LIVTLVSRPLMSPMVLSITNGLVLDVQHVSASLSTIWLVWSSDIDL
jgi:hypothetical protein